MTVTSRGIVAAEGDTIYLASTPARITIAGSLGTVHVEVADTSGSLRLRGALRDSTGAGYPIEARGRYADLGIRGSVVTVDSDTVQFTLYPHGATRCDRGTARIPQVPAGMNRP